jgi:hypothetical protein
MDDVTRRDALVRTATTGMATVLGTAVHAAADDKDKTKPPPSDRERVIACGMTDAEADCWEQTAIAAGKFFALPKLHVMDDHEVAHAIHIIQHKLLSRPAYRRYLELSKAKR